MYLTDQQIEDLLRKVAPGQDHPTIGSYALEAIQMVRAAAAEHADATERTCALDGTAEILDQHHPRDGYTGEVHLTIKFKLSPELSPRRLWNERRRAKNDGCGKTAATIMVTEYRQPEA